MSPTSDAPRRRLSGMVKTTTSPEQAKEVSDMAKESGTPAANIGRPLFATVTKRWRDTKKQPSEIVDDMITPLLEVTGAIVVGNLTQIRPLDPPLRVKPPDGVRWREGDCGLLILKDMPPEFQAALRAPGRPPFRALDVVVLRATGDSDHAGRIGYVEASGEHGEQLCGLYKILLAEDGEYFILSPGDGRYLRESTEIRGVYQDHFSTGGKM